MTDKTVPCKAHHLYCCTSCAAPSQTADPLSKAAGLEAPVHAMIELAAGYIENGSKSTILAAQLRRIAAVMTKHQPADPAPHDAQSEREALAKINAALATVSALCDGTERWTMRVPAEPDRDPDLVISGALEAAKDLILSRTSDRDAINAALEALRACFDYPADVFDIDAGESFTMTVRGFHLHMVRAAIRALQSGEGKS